MRLSKKKAAMAIAPKTWVLIDQLRSEGTVDDEGYDAPVGSTQPECDRNRAINALDRLGDRVTVERVASPSHSHRA